MGESENLSKSWATLGVFKDFETANIKKQSLLKAGNKLVKIKRCGKDGLEFKVKFVKPKKTKQENLSAQPNKPNKLKADKHNRKRRNSKARTKK
jgi:hypothetical protein